MAGSHSSKTKMQEGEQPWMHGLAGVLGGSMAMMMFYPLDFLRTRMHTLHQGSRTMPLRSAREIVRQEGLRGMYRGMTVSVISHSLGWGMYLLTFRSAEKKVEEWLPTKTDAPWWSESSKVFLSACAAATVTGAMITPLHVIKTRRQLYDASSEAGQARGLDGVRSIVRNEGWRAMFRGIGPQILLTSNTTVQVTLYEFFRRHFFTDHDDPSAMQVAFASAFSKAVACVLFNPLEVVRTRLQDKRNRMRPEYRSMRAGLETIWRMEGFTGLYRALPVNVARVIPSTVMSFILYEKCLWLIRRTNAKVHTVSPATASPMQAGEDFSSAPRRGKRVVFTAGISSQPTPA